jgi:2-polyprenyl-3-methyl-5-hydroxy-6-metoxy-1,4-benzoquinol methylase
MSEIKYQVIIDLYVKNNSHTMAFEYIDRVANGQLLQVLEVGCSSGYFGSALKAAGHTVWGIEPDKASATIAGEKLDYVFVGLIEDFMTAFPDKKFDVISFGDVLEHIAYPNEMLDQCHHLLVEGGVIVASVPNVAHISVRAMLLEGRWEYSELGILDKTHLRFFTRKTIEELFVDSAYTVVDINAVKLSTELIANICKIPFNQLAVDCVESFAADDRQYDFQYVLLAVPANAKKGRGSQLLLEKPKTNVLALALNVEQSHFNVRLGDPLRAWAAIYGGDLVCKTFQDCDQQSIAWADVVVVQRHLDIQVMKVISVAAHLGKKVVFEIDDLMIDLPEFLSHHKVGLAGYAAALGSTLRQTNCVTVTTKRLGQQLERFSRPITVIPNCVSAGELQPIDPKYWANGVATIVVASTDTVLIDFILPAISELMKRKDISVKVLVIGPLGDAFDRAGVKCERVPNFTYDEFKKFIRTIENPIGVIPLDDSLFSSCKSPVKYFDYSLAGIPVICSDVPPYADVVKNGVNGLLVANNTTENWVNAIEQLVQSVTKRKEITAQAISFVEKEYSIASAAKHWNTFLIKLNIGSFDYNHPVLPTEFEKRIAQSKFLLTHLVRPASYKAALRVLKRDGVKSMVRRIFPTSI